MHVKSFLDEARQRSRGGTVATWVEGCSGTTRKRRIVDADGGVRPGVDTCFDWRATMGS